MAETQTYVNIALFLTMVVGFTALNLADDTGAPIREATHACVAEETKAYCFEIRDYSDKINYRCLYDETNKRKYYSCGSGWEEIPEYVEPEPQPTNNNPSSEECVQKPDSECCSYDSGCVSIP